MRNLFKATLVLAIMAVCGACALSDELTAKVNVVLDDGTIMLYAGSKKGVSEGDVFEVSRGGEAAGHIRAIRVEKLFTYAELIDGDVKEMDLATRTREATETAKVAVKEEPVERKRKDAKKKETKKKKRDEKDKKKSASRRREKAKKDLKADDSASQEDETQKKTPRKVAKKKKSKKAKKKDKGKSGYPEAAQKPAPLAPLGALRPSGYGLSGLLFMPTADSYPKGRYAVHFVYANADSGNLNYKDIGLGVTYGLGDNVEIAFTRLSSELDAPVVLPAGAQTERNTNIYSFKFRSKNTTPPAFIADTVTEIRYAAGLRLYSSEDVSVPGVNAYNGYGGGSSASRLFAVATAKYTTGIGHAGLFYQSGDMVSDSDYDGLGILLGVEYPLKAGLRSGTDSLSVIFEYDSKAFYLGTLNSPNLGLRYLFRETGHATIAIADVSDASLLVFEGAYDF